MACEGGCISGGGQPRVYDNTTNLKKKSIVYIGTIDDFGKVDTDLAKQMSANFAKYFAVVALNSDGTPVGYLGISWCDPESVPDINVIKNKLFTYDKTFSQLLDLRIQMRIN